MTDMVEWERVGDLVCQVGESPLWHADEGAWYWVDIPAKTIWRMHAASGRLRNWTTSEMVACIALQDTGDLIAGMETGLFSLVLGNEQQAGEVPLACPPELVASMRFNDGRCDRQGRFWSGTMVRDMGAAQADGKLYRYTAEDGLSAPMVSDLIVQNGLAWSPDGTTMYLSDSHPSKRLVWAYDYDATLGLPSNRRVFADLHLHTGRPDGAAMDVDGGYWICANDGGCILRFAPDGTLTRRIEVPMAKPAMCSFGGAHLDTMMVTSIPSGKPGDEVWGGAVITLRPGVCGMPETRFRT